MTAGLVDLDRSRLTEFSAYFASRLFDRLPELERYARMVLNSEGGGFDLAVVVPSPSGDPIRQVTVWMDECDEPSVEFGKWHTHGSVESNSDDLAEQSDHIIDLTEAILSDQVVLAYDIGGPHDGHEGSIDLREDDALLEELTSEFSPGRVQIRTWSGKNEREVGLEDLTLT